MPDIVSATERKPEDVTIEAEEVFSRTHSDGKEFSGTLEQARQVCPALGRMTVENAHATLQEEDLAARVAQRGREKRLAETDNANEHKAHSAKPVIVEKDTAKLEVKQIGHDDYSRSVTEAILIDTQQEQVFEAVHQAEVSTQTPAPEAHDLLLQQAEAARISQITNEIHDDTVNIVDNEDLKVSYPDTLVDETATRPVFVEEISQFEVAQPDAPEQRSIQYLIDGVEQTGIPDGLDEPFHVATDGQVDVEPPQYYMTKETEPVDQQENVTDHELLGEDEVILLLADFEQSKAEIIVDDPAESLTGVSVPELSAPFKEIKTAIMQIAEVLELAETNETQKVHQIIEEIITLQNNLEDSPGEAEKDVEQKLEELFIRLFKETDTEYTPELVESFVTLTQEHYFKELLSITIEAEDEMPTLPDEIGTREFLQKLQHGLSAMMQAVTNFYEIGKSILRLYGLASAVPEFAV